MDSAETERKYDPDPSSTLPELTAIPGIDHVGDTSETLLEAVYYDTGSLELAARGMTLRRRTGGIDPGWHLKLPAGPDSRTEIHSPLGQPDHVPAELLDHLAAITRGRELSPVARLSTRRSTHPLHGPGGEHLADFTDDSVHAVPLHDLGPETEWREWEIELVHATPKLFSAAKPALKAAGAVPSAHTSKLARALSFADAVLRGDDEAEPQSAGLKPVVAVAAPDKLLSQCPSKNAVIGVLHGRQPRLYSCLP